MVIVLWALGFGALLLARQAALLPPLLDVCLSALRALPQT
jgi:hypothetical protein